MRRSNRHSQRAALYGRPSNSKYAVKRTVATTREYITNLMFIGLFVVPVLVVVWPIITNL